MNKGRFHIKVRECRNTWLDDLPRSWKPVTLRICRRRETRLIENIENQESENLANGWRYDVYDDEERNMELHYYLDWLDSCSR